MGTPGKLLARCENTRLRETPSGVLGHQIVGNSWSSVRKPDLGELLENVGQQIEGNSCIVLGYQTEGNPWPGVGTQQNVYSGTQTFTWYTHARKKYLRRWSQNRFSFSLCLFTATSV